VRRRAFVAHPRHPVTGRQFRVSATSARKLAALLDLVDQYREELRLGARSSADVARQLRRLSRGAVSVARVVDLYAARDDLSPHTRRRVRGWLAGPAASCAIASWTIWTPELRAVARRRASPGGAVVHGSGVAHSAGARALRGRAGLVDRSPWGAWRPSTRAASHAPVRELRECCRTAGELGRLLMSAEADQRRTRDQSRGGRGAWPARLGACAADVERP